jgi:hypothetical protein
MFSLCKKLKFLKRPLKELNKLHFSHISERVARAEAALENHQTVLHDDRDNLQLLEHDKQLRLTLMNLKSVEKMFFSQKLKCHFFKDSDRGSSFFHALMNQKNRRNYIPAIHCSDGTLTTSEAEMGEEFVRFYQQLLGSCKATLPLDIDVIQSGPCLHASSHESLLAPVSNDDIKNALFDIGNDKAPGPDGYSSFFFKKSWGVIGGEFCAAVQNFFTSGELLRQVNHSIIALIPKAANVNTAADFRPISCCNVVYKVISKILSGRLASALNAIISPMQNAFIGGRMMSDNINLVQELLRHYGRKRASPRCLMKVDFKKAFDSVQWHFLRQLLHMFGFPDRFVHLIMKCVETTSFSVAVNGTLYGFFPGKSGVRQGDPLSPYLFILCMEYFSRMLKLASRNGDFHFHPKCNVHDICHLAFADDVLLLSRGDRHSVSTIFKQLILFGQTSGLTINAEKSSIYFGGVSDNMKRLILHDTGFREGGFPFKYLGVPLSPHRLLASQFSPLLQKLELAVQSWMGKHLSYAGRLELVRTVLYGMVQFWLSIFSMPSSVINQIICICRNFLWSGNHTNSNSALVAWKQLCLPKKEGGLGLFDLKARNKSFLAKQLWNIHLKTDSIWIQWVHHFYLQQNTLWAVTAHHSSSPLWKSIILLKDQLLEDCGSQEEAVALLRQWNRGDDNFSVQAYNYFRLSGPQVNWARVVWEKWSMPRHNFILWLAVLGKLRTKDRLRFFQIDTLCVLCGQTEESHSHLFFTCSWSACLWLQIKLWLRINRRMMTLTSAIRGLNSGGNNLEARMRRVSLGLTVYLIWEERNKRIFDGKNTSVGNIFRKFQILFYTVFHFYEKDHHILNVG